LPDSRGSGHESLAIIATKVPQAVFCLLTALQFHELTTQLPRQVWIAVPHGSHAPKIDWAWVYIASFNAYVSYCSYISPVHVTRTNSFVEQKCTCS
jgi:predicted transcriptional regulator of viral defense system